MQTIAIIDYGMGNLLSVTKALKSFSSNIIITSSEKEIFASDKIILPGVGHYKKAMEIISSKNLLECVNEFAITQKKPVLGICLGMQLMCNSSEEGNCSGLKWIDAEVKKINLDNKNQFKIPHIGWNTLHIIKAGRLLKNISDAHEFYFSHSYCISSNNKEAISANTNYSDTFVSAFEQDNIFGVQFHPEKSFDSGKILFQNFIAL